MYGMIETRQKQLAEVYPSSHIVDDLLFELSEYTIEVLEDYLGDSAQWLSWYINDNDWGEENLEAGYDGNTQVINTTEKLAKLIDEGKER